jgi:glycosyltransferase involved in cell wall biosynthesis
MSVVAPVTAVIINFRTPELLERAVTSFRNHYPATPLLLIDNGSGDDSPHLMSELRDRWPLATEVILNDSNRHHGPAMDQALRTVRSPYVLFLDSDCEVVKGGMLEGLLARAEADPHHYATGKKIFMNPRGFDVPEREEAIPYIRPICMLIHRERYLVLPPFERHGAPCLVNMKAATARGFSLIHFPVEDFVLHTGRGTASIYGYRLGLRGKLNHLLNRLGF